MFAALIAAGAFMKITIPVQPVEMHVTLQFFFVLLAGFVLGARGALASVCAYLAVGLCGFPVFATGGGFLYLLKPTFGFLGGFAAAGFLTGAVYERLRGPAFWRFLAAAVCGLLADYVCGMLYFYVCSNYVLHVPVGLGVVFVNCFLLTVFPDFLLCILAAAAARRLIPVLRGI
ncbi:MAG: biotin transporter BioY [Lachnospiraceae bacterium]|jgi:biotin transport system substrate-specific component|nr:biotin transporter BioY [Lachnospiraceae bacterium]